MLIVAGTITLDPAKRPDAEVAFDKVREATLQEPGCLAYQAYGDRKDAGTIFLFEKWESQDALTAHFGTSHMAEFGAALGGLGVTGMEVVKYESTDLGPVM